jgi:hypothetical protein
MRPSMIDEHLPHDARGDAEEVRAIAPVGAVLLDMPGEAHVGLVHERGWLQGVVGALAPNVVRREIAQLFVDDGNQLFETRPIALTDGGEQTRDVARSVGHRRVAGRCGTP